MIQLDVPEMSCGHCKATVENAIAGADPGARVTVDLVARRVVVQGGQAAAPTLIAALDAVGFDAHPA